MRQIHSNRKLLTFESEGNWIQFAGYSIRILNSYKKLNNNKRDLFLRFSMCNSKYSVYDHLQKIG